MSKLNELKPDCGSHKIFENVKIFVKLMTDRGQTSNHYLQVL